jgi:hypothetical protein
VLLVIGAVFVAVVFILPIVSGPRVEPPSDLQFGNPSAVAVQVTNQNVTPLTDFKYDCEMSNLTLANGSELTDAKVLVQGNVRKIGGRRATLVRCEAAYFVAAPLKAITYKLTIEYRSYPWRQRRSRAYQIAAQINGDGQIIGWKLK